MLARFIKQQRPQIVFIVEPKMGLCIFREAFLKGLNLSLIAETNGNQKQARDFDVLLLLILLVRVGKKSG